MVGGYVKYSHTSLANIAVFVKAGLCLSDSNAWRENGNFYHDESKPRFVLTELWSAIPSLVKYPKTYLVTLQTAQGLGRGAYSYGPYASG